MKYQSVIVDDEPLARKVIRDYIKDIPDLHILDECSSALEVPPILSENQVDILYIDIQMPRLNGIEFVRQLKEPPLIIFTTAYSEYAVEAFEVEAFDYLVKPFSFERFYTSFLKVKNYLADTDNQKPVQTITIREGKRIYRINLDDITYLQAYGDYIRIFTEEKTYLTLMTLQHMQDLLDQSFQRVHRSYIVRLDKIHYVEGHHLVINEEKIPISNTYRDQLLARI